MPGLPPLLTLPRELRDQIYGYVYHEKRFNWGHEAYSLPDDDDDDEYDFEEEEIEQESTENGETIHAEVAPEVVFTTLIVHNCPGLGLLLAHPQLSDEYQTHVRMQELAISIHVDMENGWPVDTYDGELNNMSYVREAAAVSVIMRQAKVITLTMEGDISSHWNGVASREIASIKIAAPNLQVLRLAVHDRITRFVHQNISATSVINIDIDIQIVLKGFAQCNPPTAQQVGLPLIQHCKAFRLGYERHYLSPPWTVPKSCTVFHVVHDVGLYVFGRDGTTTYKWKPSDVVEQSPLEAYPDELLEMLPHDLAEKLEVYTCKTLGWKELDLKSGEKWG
jgi:hypothetical protein